MLRRLWSWSLACALLVAQTLGAMHAVAHARGPAWPGAQAHAQAKTFTTVAGLFKAHDSPGCRLFDQLSHGDAAAPGAPAASLPVAPAAPSCCVASASAARRTAWSLARAPPVLA